MTRPYGKHYLTDERRKLAEENLPLVWWYLGKLIAKGQIDVSEKDDARRYAAIGLIKSEAYL